ncbi:hypothetical protein [Burkholderia sp. Bp8986]|uniref:hypothetical protein n=1 Tax=Burkholderia sp. Bp8986 TaxID=2184550 RepID=UPI0016395D3F|nr:hypothetical protein [Burkholderia sp. Bp8986]
MQPVYGIHRMKLEPRLSSCPEMPRDARAVRVPPIVAKGPDWPAVDAGKIAGWPAAAAHRLLPARPRGLPRVGARPVGPDTRCRPAPSQREPRARIDMRRADFGTPPFITHFEEFTMARIGAFCLTTWLAAAILYFGQHSVAMIALSGVVVFGGFDLLRP